MFQTAISQALVGSLATLLLLTKGTQGAYDKPKLAAAAAEAKAHILEKCVTGKASVVELMHTMNVFHVHGINKSGNVVDAAKTTASDLEQAVKAKVKDAAAEVACVVAATKKALVSGHSLNDWQWFVQNQVDFDCK